MRCAPTAGRLVTVCVTLGAGAVLLNRGKHNVQLGVEHAPACTDPETVHELGITLGYPLL